MEENANEIWKFNKNTKKSKVHKPGFVLGKPEIMYPRDRVGRYFGFSWKNCEELVLLNLLKKKKNPSFLFIPLCRSWYDSGQ